MARIRVGSLATRARRHKHHLDPSPACPCCLAPVEDDAHVVAGCPSTGSADWSHCIQEAWSVASTSSGLSPPLPSPAWLAIHHLQLMAALIPCSLLHDSLLPPSAQARFFSHLHKELAASTATILGRRETLIITNSTTTQESSSSHSRQHHLPCPLPLERQLAPSEMRRLEQARRHQLSNPNNPAVASSSSSPSSPSAPVPASGPPRQRWMQLRLMTLLHEDTVPCPVRLGSTSPMLVELFERVTGEPFTDTPGSLLTSRIKSMGRVLRDVLKDHGMSFTPPLETAKKRDYVALNRFPRVPCPDIPAWRTRTMTAEQYHAPQLRPRQITASQDAYLPQWIRGHRYLRPVDATGGESGMALLLLWEVDHAKPWPSTASSQAGRLASFTKRLTQQVNRDEELKEWFNPKELQRPLAPGLPDSHHSFWPVQITRPPTPEPQGWYKDFVSRWKVYLASLTTPLGVSMAREVDPDPTPSQHPQKRRRKASQMLWPQQHPKKNPPERGAMLKTVRLIDQPSGRGILGAFLGLSRGLE